MKENLIVGSTSQIAHFFSDDSYEKINSRKIDYTSLDRPWKTVILAFGENRKNIKELNLYKEVNVDLTIRAVDFFSIRSERVVVFSTCELWSKTSGPVDFKTPFEFFQTPYILSKKEMTDRIIESGKYKNVDVIFPFNFNSTHRDQNFLFGKIFNSILNEVKIEIGDTYFYRDLIHPNFVASRIMDIKGHQILGSGRLTFVNDFIRDLYKAFNLNYEDFVSENLSGYSEYEKKFEYYYKSEECLYSYETLLADTIKEIEEKKLQIRIISLNLQHGKNLN
jgi:hypothetical protein